MIRLDQLVKLLPKLSYHTIKGSHGVVGVIGGSFQYTGAPYYTAMSALKMGADLTHIFCSREAAGPIKTYSPELIVHPVFDYNSETVEQLSQQNINLMTDKWVEYLKKKVDRISSWVIGPGLGRTKTLSAFFAKFINMLPDKTYLVIDADGLFFLCQHPYLFQKLSLLNCTVTPNNRQFFHLNQLLKVDQKYLDISQILKSEQPEKGDTNLIAYSRQIQTEFPFTIVIKGEKDIILHRNKTMTVVNTLGGMKRCGGIGDVLAGCLACFSLWDYEKGPILACHITKMAARAAFEKHRRSLTGLGVMQQLEEVVKTLD